MVFKNDAADSTALPSSRNLLLDELAVFALAEEGILAAAARKIDEPMRTKLRDALAFEMQCAAIGDVDAVIKADAMVETLMCLAAGEPEAAAELQIMKKSFKDLWSNRNRFRDISPDTTHREHQVAAVIASDEQAAVAAVRRFYADVRSRI